MHILLTFYENEITLSKDLSTGSVDKKMIFKKIKLFRFNQHV